MVYSQHGDLAPLGDIVRLVIEHGTYLIVDDAHGTGVIGDTCRGVIELHDLLRKWISLWERSARLLPMWAAKGAIFPGVGKGSLNWHRNSWFMVAGIWRFVLCFLQEGHKIC